MAHPGHDSAADQPDDRTTARLGRARPNLTLPTLGGLQLWADVQFCGHWHIQRNVVSGHYRLLDGRQIRRAWGSLEQCRHRLEQYRAQRHLPPMSGQAVIVMHGLLRSSLTMSGLARYLRKAGNYTVFNVNYPSTILPVREHAAALAQILAHLDGIEEIHFVCHSLGNLVVRHYLADCERGLHGGVADARIRRMVMLGPPNHGAQMAGIFGTIDPLGFMAAAQEIRKWKELESLLATPRFPFGVIAGGRGQATRGYNPLLSTDNDLIVTVESTRLAGAADFLMLPVLHGLMMDNRQVRQHTLNFLQHGWFVAEHHRQPIDAAATGNSGSMTTVTPPADNPPPRMQPHTLPPRGRIAGIDFGTVRIGVAVADVETQIASPLANYNRRTPALDCAIFCRVGQARGHRAVCGRAAGASQRRRESKIARSSPLWRVADRSDGRRSGLFRRAVHFSRSRTVFGPGPTDQKETQGPARQTGRANPAVGLPGNDTRRPGHGSRSDVASGARRLWLEPIPGQGSRRVSQHNEVWASQLWPN